MSEGSRYAVLIGNGRFDREPKLTPLRCPTRDVDGMREILAAPELGAFTEVFPLKDAGNHEVLQRIDEVLADSAGDDQVLIYYSGHGQTDLPGRLYLAAANTEVRKLVSTSIPIETLRLQIENSHCRRIVVILDCCYGGAAGKSFSRGSVDEKLKELARGSGVYILTASTASQIAEEREGDDYGLLTKHIIAGIKDGDADVNEDGSVSMDDLYDYTFARVKEEGHQEPMRWALNVKGQDLIIARTSGASLREKQRALTDKLIEIRSGLPSRVFVAALQAIQDRRAPFYGLADDLHRGRLGIGEFIEEWYHVESEETRESSEKPRVQPVEPQEAPQTPTSSKPVRRHRRQKSQLSAGPRLLQFSFETITLDENGNETDRRTLQADYFSEDLGDGVTLDIVKIPNGVFLRGSPEGEPGRGSNEAPQEQVSVGEFSMGRFAVTREQWRQVALMPKVKIDLNEEPSYFKDSWRQPVEQVSWDEAVEFCARLSKKTEVEYRLPSEGEWEYACRARTTTPFAFGATITPKVVNNNGSYPYGSAPQGEYRQKTVEVGSLGFANGFGLYDMHGNVWEWCEDVYHDSYSGAPTDGSAWTAGGDQTCRVLRGGSWSNYGKLCRSALRARSVPEAHRNFNGFRVVYGARTR